MDGAITPRNTFIAGRDLQTGDCVRCIASGEGEVVDAPNFLLATDQLGKNGNRLMVNCQNGACVYASPSSIWSK